MEEFYEFIANRRSIRKYKRQPIAMEQLTRILEAGKWAPSAHNVQPWRFFVFQSVEEKKKLARAMGERYRQSLVADSEEPKLIEDLVEGSIERFSAAPVLILACLTMEGIDMYSDMKRREVEFSMAVQSVAAALQLILLASHAEGLAACWFCAPLFCPGTVRRVVGLSDELYPQALVTLGVDDETPEPPVRNAFDEFVTFIDERR